MSYVESEIAFSGIHLSISTTYSADPIIYTNTSNTHTRRTHPPSIQLNTATSPAVAATYQVFPVRKTQAGAIGASEARMERYVRSASILCVLVFGGGNNEDDVS